MARTDLIIAIGHHQHRVGALNTAAEKFEQIERRFVRPVHVFKHDQCARALQLVERCRKDCVAVGAGIDRRQQRTLRLARDVVKRSESPGGEERIARAPKHPRLALLLRELLQQRGLADTRFTAHQRDAAAVPGSGMEPLSQVRETSFTLEQFH